MGGPTFQHVSSVMPVPDASLMQSRCASVTSVSLKPPGWLHRLCESVAANLVGQKLGSFRLISTAVKAALEAALTRILTPKRSIDVLREVHAARARGKPYTMVFVGVNGVGKSTNLAKIAYWLLQNKVKVRAEPSILPGHQQLPRAQVPWRFGIASRTHLGDIACSRKPSLAASSWPWPVSPCTEPWLCMCR